MQIAGSVESQTDQAINKKEDKKREKNDGRLD
jgi:hypothetical protein